ncbi:hypothetical protein SNE40_014418 [Patella caerulea]|uniref:WD repeat-containing protein WRAP73 n=1 Tax=Patella caerulea TaxID=87958 RepID=A0AAN8JEC4_PATCE
MNFSELFHQSGQLCRFSPDGKYLASAVDYRLVIRNTDTLQIENVFSCIDSINYIEWSNDSGFILCAMIKRSVVQVWSVEQPEWICKINEGPAGLNKAIWSPDGRHILTTADFNIRITVWSLLSKSVSYIRYPKQCEKSVAFSNNGKFMALAERRDCSDFISIFACDNWTLLKNFECDTEDLAGVNWSPNDWVLCVWESELKYKVLIYHPDGSCLSKYSAYNWALGIKSISWSPTSQFLVIGSYDEKVRILNNRTWQKLIEFSHPATIDEENVAVYKEIETKTPSAPLDLDPPTASLFNAQSRYECQVLPVEIPVVKPNVNKAHPKIGVSTCSFSPDSKYMFTRNDNMPCVLWIWEIKRLSLCAALMQAAPIKCVKWDPVRTRLALCTGNNKLYMWSPEGSLSVDVPAGRFNVQSIIWHPSGDSLLLLDKDMMCVLINADNRERES